MILLKFCLNLSAIRSMKICFHGDKNGDETYWNTPSVISIQ